MCFDPMTATAMALSGMQSAVSFAADRADYDARADQWRRNYTSALASGRDEQRQLSLRMLEEEQAHVENTRQNMLEGAEVAAEAEASAAAGGVAGISFNNILAGVRRKVSDKQRIDTTNYRNTVAQLAAEKRATNTRIQNRINSVQRPMAPNPLGHILQGIGGAMRHVPTTDPRPAQRTRTGSQGSRK